MSLKPCEKCGGEIKPIEDIFKNSPDYSNFRKEMEKIGIPESQHYNCVVCGQIYDEDLNRVNLKLGWLDKKV